MANRRCLRLVHHFPEQHGLRLQHAGQPGQAGGDECRGRPVQLHPLCLCLSPERLQLVGPRNGRRQSVPGLGQRQPGGESGGPRDGTQLRPLSRPYPGMRHCDGRHHLYDQRLRRHPGHDGRFGIGTLQHLRKGTAWLAQLRNLARHRHGSGGRRLWAGPLRSHSRRQLQGPENPEKHGPDHRQEDPGTTWSIARPSASTAFWPATAMC